MIIFLPILNALYFVIFFNQAYNGLPTLFQSLKEPAFNFIYNLFFIYSRDGLDPDPLPKRCPCHNPEELWVCYVTGKRHFVNVIKLGILWLGDNPGLSEQPNLITWALLKAGGERDEKEEVKEAPSQWNGFTAGSVSGGRHREATELRTVLSWQPARNQVPQSYNHKELHSANNLN